MIKLLRVDHRLLHGQVVFSWEQIHSINLGGTKALPGTHQVTRMIYLTDEEEKLLAGAQESGISVNIQPVPSEAVIDYKPRTGVGKGGNV